MSEAIKDLENGKRTSGTGYYNNDAAIMSKAVEYLLKWTSESEEQTKKRYRELQKEKQESAKYFNELIERFKRNRPIGGI